MYYNGKCYARLGKNDCSHQILWKDAQNSCVNDIGSGNAGRLATFGTCTDYTAVKNGISTNNNCHLWIGIENADTLPIWADPQGVCSLQLFNSTGNWGGSCNGSQWKQGGSGNPFIYIDSNWGDWKGDSSSGTHSNYLCEFGKRHLF